MFVQLSLMLETNLSADAPNQQERVRDRLWLWTHPAGSYNDEFFQDQPTSSSIEPVDAVLGMGLRNALFVRHKGVPKLPFDSYYTPFEKLDRVCWSLTGATGATSSEEREHVLKLAEKNQNITSFIMDDFFHPDAHVPVQGLAEKDALADSASVPMRAALTPDELAELRKRLIIGGQRIPLQVVVYSHAIIPQAALHLRHVDAITLWTWDQNELKNLEQNLTRLEKLAPGKEIVLGCYMYDFDKRKPLPVKFMKQQTEVGYQWLCQGRIEGIIFLASPLCDLDLESVEWTRQWIHRVGDRALLTVKDSQK